jgi:hypothetical protein
MNHIFKLSFIACFLMIAAMAVGQNSEFAQYFEDNTLRVDYYLSGNKTSEQVILAQNSKLKGWAGASKLTAQPVIKGNYRYNVTDSASGKFLYSNGFSGLFNEWQTTEEAARMQRSFYHVALVPFPRATIKVTFQKYQINTGQFTTLYEWYVNPSDYFIVTEQPIKTKYTLISGNGNKANIDIAFLAEGYKATEMKKFRADAARIWNYITTIEPFKSYASKFNIYAVESVSEQSGTDIPGKGIYVNTVLSSSFYTFDVERYLTVPDIKAMHNFAAAVPYEHLFVLINSTKYGGGGFYNFYCSTTTNHELSLKVAIHEFGHSFAGLADEYYASEVAYSDFYNVKVEPWEPNITTLVNFESKWKNMINDTVPVPTPRINKYNNVVGVFEGGGYLEKGIYSPVQDCRMKSNQPPGFCPVCRKAIEQTIQEHIH